MSLCVMRLLRDRRGARRANGGDHDALEALRARLLSARALSRGAPWARSEAARVK